MINKCISLENHVCPTPSTSFIKKLLPRISLHYSNGITLPFSYVYPIPFSIIVVFFYLVVCSFASERFADTNLKVYFPTVYLVFSY